MHFIAVLLRRLLEGAASIWPRNFWRGIGSTMQLERLSTDGNGIALVSVMVQRTPSCTTHAGILYRDTDDKLWHLHFAWHKDLRRHALHARCVCAQPTLETEHAILLAAVCERIAALRLKLQIPYNLKHDRDVAFDPDTGEVTFGPMSTGLSCSTFVAAVFRSSGQNLIDATTWPSANAEDQNVQQLFVRALEQSGNPDQVHQAHIVKSEIGTARIRPEHVCGACLYNLPADHQQCHVAGHEIIRRLDEHLATCTP
jgi:hypothetical protein